MQDLGLLTCVSFSNFVVLLETGQLGRTWELRTPSNKSPECIWPKEHGGGGRKTALLILFGFSGENDTGKGITQL